MSTDRLIELARLQRKIEAEINRAQRDIPQRRRRSRYDIPPCGTETGYQRHRYLGEKCDECREAHAAHNRLKERAKRRSA